jgi:hypothetical protein
MKRSIHYATLVAALFAPAYLHAQQGAAQDPIPQIVTSGTGETQITPDRARIDIAVETRGPTAAAAATENARIAQSVLARIKVVGLTDEQLSTWGYNVNPEYDYSRNDGRPRIIGYVARNTVRADVRRIDQVGTVIDAAVAAGANNIGGLDFYSSDLNDARRAALREAVAVARADAEVMAVAAGGRLGPLLELSSSFYSPPPNMPYMARAEVMSAQADKTPMSPGERTVTATVNARWRYIAP